MDLRRIKLEYEIVQEQLLTTNEQQISTTDPDSRALLVHGQVVEVCYNIKTAVDEKHKLVIYHS
ncbi:MAG: hypothetical protein IPQ10_14695 [Saprospiraceae bacterium]|nr:hypothetical protein [Saprospiraceae bacterium]